jgi:hypothetical protein
MEALFSTAFFGLQWKGCSDAYPMPENIMVLDIRIDPTITQDDLHRVVPNTRFEKYLVYVLRGHSRWQGSALEARIALDLISRIATSHGLSSRFLLAKPIAALESSLSIVRVDLVCSGLRCLHQELYKASRLSVYNGINLAN